MADDFSKPTDEPHFVPPSQWSYMPPQFGYGWYPAQGMYGGGGNCQLPQYPYYGPRMDRFPPPWGAGAVHPFFGVNVPQIGTNVQQPTAQFNGSFMPQIHCPTEEPVGMQSNCQPGITCPHPVVKQSGRPLVQPDGKITPNSAAQQLVPSSDCSTSQIEVVTGVSAKVKNVVPSESDGEDSEYANQHPDRIEKENDQTDTESQTCLPRGRDRVYARDPNFKALRHYILSEPKNHLLGISRSEKNVIRTQAKNFSIAENGGLLFKRKGEILAYPEDDKTRRKLMTEVHLRFNHCRLKLMMQKVCETHFWNSLREDVELFVNSCRHCQEGGKGLLKVKNTLQQIRVESKAWWLVGMDFTGPLETTSRGNRYILTLVDYYTKWPEAVALPNKDAVTTARALHEIYCRNGAPHRILTDNGGEWVNELNENLRNLHGIKHSLTRPYNPQCNGMVEKFNGSLKRHLESVMTTYGGEWDMNLNHALLHYRTKPHTATQYPPFDLFMSWQFRFDPSEHKTAEEDQLVDFLESNPNEQSVKTKEASIAVSCAEMHARFAEAKELIESQATANIDKERFRQKKSFNKRNNNKKADVVQGDSVLFYPKNLRNKLYGSRSKTLSAGQIIDTTSTSVKLRLPDGKKVNIARSDVRVPKRVAATAPLKRPAPVNSPKNLRGCYNAEDILADLPDYIELSDVEHETEHNDNASTSGNTLSDLGVMYRSLAAAKSMPKVRQQRRAPTRTLRCKKTVPRSAYEQLGLAPLSPRRYVRLTTPNGMSTEAAACDATTVEDSPLYSTDDIVENRFLSPKPARKGGRRNITSSEDGGNIPDSEPSTEQKRLARVAEIEVILSLFQRVFTSEGLRSVLESWEALKVTKSPRFPDLPGVITRDHVKTGTANVAGEVKEELYKKFNQTPAEALLCIDSAAWLKLSAYLDHQAFEENRITSNVVWRIVSGIRLSLADKNRLETDSQLNDEIMNAVNTLLRSQFPGVAGFRGTLNFTVIQNSHQSSADLHATIDRLRSADEMAKKSFKRHLAAAQFRQVQILFVKGNHWITVSNIHGESREYVYLYDSLPPDYKFWPYYQHQIASVFHEETPKIHLLIPPMCRQPNYVDCGVYAVANAVALAFGRKPEEQNYVTEAMRQHLLNCLTNRKFELFPVRRYTRSSDAQTLQVMRQEEILLQCKCRTPSLYYETKLRCQNKDKGCPFGDIHQACTAHGRKIWVGHDRPLRYTCPFCQKKYIDSKKGGKSSMS